MITFAEIKRFDNTNFGRVRAIGQAGQLPSGDGRQVLFISLEGLDPAPAVGWYYDGSTFSESVPGGAVEPKQTLTASAFWMGRFTGSERADVWATCNGENVAGVTINQRARYRLAAFRDVSLAGEPIPLHAAEVSAVVNGLESAGLLSAGRAAEILA